MSVSDETTTVSDGILLSDAAAAKVKGLLDQEGRDDLALRVAVQPGGCSGLRYQLFFDERSLDGDVVKDFDGVKVVTDRMSAPYLGGASIDFVDTIEKQGFTIDNPNATGSCACGARSAKSSPVSRRRPVHGPAAGRRRTTKAAPKAIPGPPSYVPVSYPRGTGLPDAVSRTVRPASGASRATGTVTLSAMATQAVPGSGRGSVIVTRTSVRSSSALAE